MSTASDPRTAALAALRVPEPWLPPEVFDALDSTNLEARRAPVPWRVVVAERQEAGRGRLARSWTTTPYAALAVSVVVPPPRASAALGWVPLLAGLAVHDAVGGVAGLSTTLKWPNDVLVPSGPRPGKLAGVLCEWTPLGVVVGTGVNVDTAPGDLPLDTATSVRAAGHPGVDRGRVLAAYLLALVGHLRDLDSDPAGAMAAYRSACGTIGSRVSVHEPTGAVRSGDAVGVDDAGRLLLETTEGTYAVSAGDVVHVR